MRERTTERYRKALSELAEAQGRADGTVYIDSGSRIYYALAEAACRLGVGMDDVVEMAGFRRDASLADARLRAELAAAADGGGAVHMPCGSDVYRHVKYVARRDGVTADDVLARYGVRRKTHGERAVESITDGLSERADRENAVRIEPGSEEYRKISYYAAKHNESVEDYVAGLGFRMIKHGRKARPEEGEPA